MSFMLNAINAECYKWALLLYCYAECRGAHMQALYTSVIMLNVIMLSVVAPQKFPPIAFELWDQS